MNKVRETRELRQLNQRQLAELTHTPQSLISSIERGVLKPWPIVAKRLSEALQTSVQELFPEDSHLLTELRQK